MVELRVEQVDPLIVDEDRLQEIALVTRLMVEATGRSGQLSQEEIDQLLDHSPVVMQIPRRDPDSPAT